MITLREQIEVPRTVEDCFNYIADFRTTVEWDATALTAVKTTPGPIREGSAFDVKCAMGPTSVDLKYEIAIYQPCERVELRGHGSLFDVHDIILLTPTDNGTHIDYQAHFTFKHGLERLFKHLESRMIAMGAESLAGLKAALTPKSDLPSTSTSAQRSDNWVLPGVAMFSRWGFKRGQKRWDAMSESMTGKHVVITGASSGIGEVMAHKLFEAGADLTLVIRSREKGEALAKAIYAESGRDSGIAIEIADLSNIAETKTVADRLLAQGKAIDVLINNAGALFNEFAETSEGLERSFALLLVSPFVLTESLKPLLGKGSESSRVINVVSGGMYTQALDCAHLICGPEDFNGAVSYARAKRALTVLTEMWADRWADDNIVVNAMHPGWADTPGVQASLPTFRRFTRLILRNAEEGADTAIWLARSASAARVTGKLFLDREIRTPYLLKSTIEAPEEREKLIALLSPFLDNTRTRSDESASIDNAVPELATG